MNFKNISPQSKYNGSFYDDDVNLDFPDIDLELDKIKSKSEELDENEILKYLKNINVRLAKIEKIIVDKDLSYLTPSPTTVNIKTPTSMQPKTSSMLSEIQSSLTQQGFNGFSGIGNPLPNQSEGDIFTQARNMNSMDFMDLNNKMSPIVVDDDVPDWD